MKEQKDFEVAIVTMTVKAPRGYRPRQSVRRFLMVTRKDRVQTMKAIEGNCDRILRETEKANGVSGFSYVKSVSWVHSLLGICWLDDDGLTGLGAGQ